MAANLSYAQSDTVVNYYDYGWKETAPANAFYYSIVTRQQDGFWVRLDFYIHNDSLQMKGRFTDKELKNKIGPFSYYHENGRLASTGRYEKNQKEGRWLSWAADGHLTDSFLYKDNIVVYGRRFLKDGKVSDLWDWSEGDTIRRKGFRENGRLFYEGQAYSNNREGLWKYYDSSGKLMMEAIYQKDSAIAFTCYDERGNIQKENCIYEREAKVKGGSSAWRKHLEKAFTKGLPTAFYRGELSGIVIVNFMIDKEGRITDVNIRASTEPRLNEAAIRMVSSGPLWEPAIQYNRKVKSYHTQPISFLRVEQ